MKTDGNVAKTILVYDCIDPGEAPLKLKSFIHR